jgi:hypothetical protein
LFNSVISSVNGIVDLSDISETLHAISDGISISLSGTQIDLSNEVSGRISADADLALSIGNEADDRRTNDSKLELSIGTEAAARALSDSYLYGLVQQSSGDLTEVNKKINEISSKIHSGLVYKGSVTAYDSSTKSYSTKSFKQLLLTNSSQTSETILLPGFLYLVTGFKDNTSTHYEIEGIKIEDNDFILINNNAADGMALSDVTSADIDVFDAMDDDIATLGTLSSVSSYIQAEITGNWDQTRKISTDIMSACYDLSTLLSNDLKSLSNETTSFISDSKILSAMLSNSIGTLSTGLSTIIRNLSTELSTAIDKLSAGLSTDIDELSTGLSTAINDLSDGLSTTLSALQSHYDKTFIKDYKVHGHDEGSQDISVDMLKITDLDPVKKQKTYVMVISNDVLALSAIN